MNVTCPNCNTLFRVDPAKVPEAGVRARCSVCSAVFAAVVIFAASMFGMLPASENNRGNDCASARKFASMIRRAASSSARVHRSLGDGRRPIFGMETLTVGSLASGLHG
jgi:predicted Zn finger-like uncharacterized protein